MEYRSESRPHEDKVLFPGAGISRADLVDYYERIAPVILPYLDQRPLTLKQYPRGIGERGFYRKHAPDYFPSYVKRVAVPRRSPGEHPDVLMATVDEVADLRYLAGQNVIEYHPCSARVDALDCPDQLVINLDPHDCDFFTVRTVALCVRDMLASMHIPVFAKLSGRRGLHLHLPVQPDATYDELRPWLKALLKQICDELPRIATREHLKRKRGSRVYVGMASNGYAQCIVAPYSVRAEPGAPIAAPVSWHELSAQQVFPGQIRMDNLFRRLGHRADPWADFRINARSARAICGTGL